MIRAAIASGVGRATLPLMCYYAVTLALPLANGADAGAAFVQHALTVLVVPIALIAIVSATSEIAAYIWKLLWGRAPGP